MCEFPAQRNETDEVWREFLVPVGKNNAVIPAFPMTFGIRGHGYETEQGRIVQWVPLGLAVLVEGNAQALQRSFLSSVVSKGMDQALEFVQTVSEPIDADSDPFDVTSGLVAPYRVTDLVLSKYLKTHHEALTKFPREWIMRLTDLALMMSSIDVFSTNPGFTWRHVRFVDGRYGMAVVS
jgi:hypothetical protein